jgi:hypothetical protein
MSEFGKLIISRCNDYYQTFHQLDLILVKGNGNKIDIDEDIGKLVINGHGNKISIKSCAGVGKITIRGNNNKIYSFYSSSLNNLSDFGHRNKIYYREDDESDEENSSNDEDDDDEQISPRVNFNLNQIRELIRQIREGLQYQEEENAQLNNEENHILNELVDVQFKNVSENVKEGNEKCVICYENFLKDENIKMTTCFHLFHFNCIKKWVQSKNRSIEPPDCPICRRKL